MLILQNQKIHRTFRWHSQTARLYSYYINYYEVEYGLSIGTKIHDLEWLWRTYHGNFAS